jgi:hypothetical protein
VDGGLDVVRKAWPRDDLGQVGRHFGGVFGLLGGALKGR